MGLLIGGKLACHLFSTCVFKSVAGDDRFWQKIAMQTT